MRIGNVEPADELTEAPGEAYKTGLASGDRMYGEIGEFSIAVYEGGDGSGVLQWMREIDTLPGDPNEALEDGRLILILNKTKEEECGIITKVVSSMPKS